MFCPKCRYEYEFGVNRCPDCDVDLVSQLPPEPQPEYDEPVAVFESGDTSVLLVAQSMLENEDIQFWLRGEGPSHLFAGGGMGLSPTAGPYKLLVRSSDEDFAREVLKDLQEELKWHRADRQRYNEDDDEVSEYDADDESDEDYGDDEYDDR